MTSKKRFYILFVSREPDGTLNKVPVPLHYAYLFAAAAVIGLFTITGLAGSYSRMLIKTARFNQLRHDHLTLQRDYAQLEKQAQQKDIQAASLGSLASEVSALYGLTTGKLTIRSGGIRTKTIAPATALNAPLQDAPAAASSAYFKSIDAFYNLRATAMNGDATRTLLGPSDLVLGGARMANPLLPRHDLRDLNPGLGDMAEAEMPSLWPVTGPITSSFGQREDPILSNGEGEFHPGIDISGPLGTPIHATADGVVLAANVVNGYGRMVQIDHGHGLVTCYGHMSGYAVTARQAVTRGEVIGYIGHSGRTTGNHVHYEVRIRNTPVNPHRYLRTTLAEFGGMSPSSTPAL